MTIFIKFGIIHSTNGRLTQLVECFRHMEEVGSSSLLSPTKQKAHLSVCLLRGRRLIDEYAAQPRFKYKKTFKVPSFAFAIANLAVGLPLAGNGKISYRHFSTIAVR